MAAGRVADGDRIAPIPERAPRGAEALREDLRVFRSDQLRTAVATGEQYNAREGATMEDLSRRYQAGELR